METSRDAFIIETLTALEKTGQVTFSIADSMNDDGENIEGLDYWDKSATIREIQTQCDAKGFLGYETRLPNGELFNA